MAMRFLDYTGLSLFWNRAKAYIDGAVAALRSALAADIVAVASADRVNLLPGTNRGAEGWSATYASGYEVRLSGSAGSNGGELRAENRAGVDVPAGAWQTIFRPLPAGLFAQGDEYVLSFEAYGTRERGSGALVVGISVGDTAATRTLADSGWQYVATGSGYARYSIRLKGLVAGSVTKAGDMLKIAFVAGQNPGWTELYIRNMKLERGTVASGYTPAPADLTDRLEEKVTKALNEIANFLDKQGMQICPIYDCVDPSELDKATLPVGTRVLDNNEGTVMRLTNSGSNVYWVADSRWNQSGGSFSPARRDVLYLMDGSLFVWDGNTLSHANGQGVGAGQPPVFSFSELTTAAAVSEESEAPEE